MYGRSRILGWENSGRQPISRGCRVCSKCLGEVGENEPHRCTMLREIVYHGTPVLGIYDIYYMCMSYLNYNDILNFSETCYFGCRQLDYLQYDICKKISGDPYHFRNSPTHFLKSAYLQQDEKVLSIPIFRKLLFLLLSQKYSDLTFAKHVNQLISASAFLKPESRQGIFTTHFGVEGRRVSICSSIECAMHDLHFQRDIEQISDYEYRRRLCVLNQTLSAIEAL